MDEATRAILEALTWYADPRNYDIEEERNVSGVACTDTPARFDGGEKAREALEKWAKKCVT